MYNLSVAREFLKQVYVAERLQPPSSLPAMTSVYSTLWARATNPAYWRELVRSGDWAKVSVYAVEAYGIFKVRLYCFAHKCMRLADGSFLLLSFRLCERGTCRLERSSAGGV